MGTEICTTICLLSAIIPGNYVRIVPFRGQRWPPLDSCRPRWPSCVTLGHSMFIQRLIDHREICRVWHVLVTSDGRGGIADPFASHILRSSVNAKPLHADSRGLAESLHSVCGWQGTAWRIRIRQITSCASVRELQRPTSKTSALPHLQ